MSANGKEYAYMNIYWRIRSDIESGAYRYGTKLPSKRSLAEKLDTSVITVQHAYGLLCDEGYIVSKQRSGYYVSYKESDFISHSSERDVQIKTVPIERAAENSFPFTVLSKTMRKVILDRGDRILKKSDGQGVYELRSAISSYLKRTVGIVAQPEQIVIGAGAEYLYSMVVQFLGNKRGYALEKPSYRKIQQVYEANGAVCELLELGSNGIKSSCLKSSCSTVLHITPFNSYPSLVTADVSKRREYLAWAKERNAIIIEDNYDSELTVSKKNEESVFSMSNAGNVIYINTFSRTISPAFRVGYLVLPTEMCAGFKEKLGFYACPVPVFEQFVIAELLESGDYERHINRVRRNKRKEM